jgi:hypothetical protein
VYLKQIQTMAFSFMMTIPAYFTEAQVREILVALGLTKDDIKIDTSPAQKTDYVKYFVHISTVTTIGATLAAQLEDVAKRQSEGEVDVYPKRIVHGTRRDGSEMYWQIYKTATPAERAAKMAEKAVKATCEKMAPRIV